MECKLHLCFKWNMFIVKNDLLSHKIYTLRHAKNLVCIYVLPIIDYSFKTINRMLPPTLFLWQYAKLYEQWQYIVNMVVGQTTWSLIPLKAKDDGKLSIFSCLWEINCITIYFYFKHIIRNTNTTLTSRDCSNDRHTCFCFMSYY